MKIVNKAAVKNGSVNRNSLYIGRTNNKLHFGNPFSHKKGTAALIEVDSRDEAVDRFKGWLYGYSDQDVEPERLQWVRENIGVLIGRDELVCWCKPAKCHGDVFKELVEEIPHKFTPEKITELGENEVFTFGSNCGGFHGAGSAGYAMYGSARNEWRTNPIFQKAYSSNDKRGLWAVLGCSKGFQCGLIGKSYAIETVEKPRVRGKVSKEYIGEQFKELNNFAKKNLHLDFLNVRMGLSKEEGGNSFYSKKDIRELWYQVLKEGGISKNIILPKEIDGRLPWNKYIDNLEIPLVRDDFKGKISKDVKQIDLDL